MSANQIFRVVDWLETRPPDLTELVQRNSPLDALKTRTKSPKPKIEAKKVLFHEKVKSSNYGQITQTRKMFQPILATKRKPKPKQRRCSVKERNFGFPEGNFVGQENGAFFESMPTMAQTSNSGSTIFVDTSNVIGNG